MDTKKIVNIFIIAFLLLNAYLLYAYYNRYNLQSVSTATNTIDLTSEMESFGIDLPIFEEAPDEMYSMQANRHNLLAERVEDLSGQAGSISADGSLYTSFLTDPIDLEGNDVESFTESDLATLRDFVANGPVLFGEAYEYTHFDPDSNSFVFCHIVDEYPVVDGTSEINLFLDNEGNIFSYHQTFAGPMIEQGQPLNLISPQEAVEVLYQNNQIPSGSTVEKPRMTYQRMLYLEDLSMYSPTWLIHIETSSGQVEHRVNAVDGQIAPNPEEIMAPQREGSTYET